MSLRKLKRPKKKSDMAQSGGMYGAYGYDQLTSADGATTGSWYAIKAVNGADAVVTVVNAQGDGSTSLTIISADVVYCTASSITVVSGTVHAYRNKS